MNHPAGATKSSCTRDVVSAAEGYRLWAQSYDTDSNPVVALEFRCVADKLDSIAGKVFLDVACGTGRWMSAATANGAQAFGVDLSGDMLEMARRKPAIMRRLIRADAHYIPVADDFADMVMCSFGLGYMRDQNRFIKELARVTRTGGKVILSDFHPCTEAIGLSRSFRLADKVFEIAHHCYSSDWLLDCGRCVGLELRQVNELRFGEPECEVLRRAGKEQLMELLCSVPIVLSIEWERR